MVDRSFYRNNGPFSLAEIARICEARISDNDKSGLEVNDIATMENARKGDVCFFYDKKAKDEAAKIKATACVTTEELAQFVAPETAVLICGNPKLAFLKLNSLFYEIPLPEAQIAASARIDKSAQLGMNCFVGENAVIGKNVKIGNNCIIEANAIIEDNCEIGQGSRIGAGAHIAFCRMGENCHIFSVMMLKSVPIPVSTAVPWMIRLSVTVAGLIIWYKLHIMSGSVKDAFWYHRSVLPAVRFWAIMSFAAVRSDWQTMFISDPVRRLLPNRV